MDWFFILFFLFYLFIYFFLDSTRIENIYKRSSKFVCIGIIQWKDNRVDWAKKSNWSKGKGDWEFANRPSFRNSRWAIHYRASHWSSSKSFWFVLGAWTWHWVSRFQATIAQSPWQFLHAPIVKYIKPFSAW